MNLGKNLLNKVLETVKTTDHRPKFVSDDENFNQLYNRYLSLGNFGQQMHVLVKDSVTSLQKSANVNKELSLFLQMNMEGQMRDCFDIQPIVEKYYALQNLIATQHVNTYVNDAQAKFLKPFMKDRDNDQQLQHHLDGKVIDEKTVELLTYRTEERTIILSQVILSMMEIQYNYYTTIATIYNDLQSELNPILNNVLSRKPGSHKNSPNIPNNNNNIKSNNNNNINNQQPQQQQRHPSFSNTQQPNNNNNNQRTSSPQNQTTTRPINTGNTLNNSNSSNSSNSTSSSTSTSPVGPSPNQSRPINKRNSYEDTINGNINGNAQSPPIQRQPTPDPTPSVTTNIFVDDLFSNNNNNSNSGNINGNATSGFNSNADPLFSFDDAHHPPPLNPRSGNAPASDPNDPFSMFSSTTSRPATTSVFDEISSLGGGNASASNRPPPTSSSGLKVDPFASFTSSSSQPNGGFPGGQSNFSSGPNPFPSGQNNAFPGQQNNFFGGGPSQQPQWGAPSPARPDHRATQEKEQDARRNIDQFVTGRVDAWAGNKKGNLRALLANLHQILWEDSGWTEMGLGELVQPGSLKKAFRKAQLVVHPDKTSNKSLEVKLLAERVFDILQDAAKTAQW